MGSATASTTRQVGQAFGLALFGSILVSGYRSSLAGLAAGAVLGARVAPHLLHGGAQSPYTPAAGLVGALIGAGLLSAAFGIAASFARGGLHLNVVDSLDRDCPCFFDKLSGCSGIKITLP